MNRLLLLTLGITTQLSLAAPTLLAQAANQGGPTATSTPVSQARPATLGEKLQVSWSGSWYDATILEIGEGQYKVHYEGWSSDWDEWVVPSRLRRKDGTAVAPLLVTPRAEPSPALVAAPKTTTSTSTAKPEAPGTRPPAPITPPAPTVPAAEATPPAPPGSTSPGSASPPTSPAPKIWSASPLGRYACRTWDYGQVNRVGEFVLQSGGRYRDLQYKGSGRYSYEKATSRITFTSGPQKTNAKVNFNAAGHDGKGHIVFDYGYGARMDCYREALD